MQMSKFMNIQEALEQRVRYLRKPFWAMPDDHLELPLLEKGFGPWAILHSPQACRDELKSQSILIFSLLNDADTDWEPYQVTK